MRYGPPEGPPGANPAAAGGSDHSQRGPGTMDEVPIPTPDPEAADEVARLVDDARALWERRKLADSEAPLRRALERAEAALGPDDPQVAWVLAHLGWLASARGRHDEAVAAYRRALAIFEARLGPDAPD